MRIELKKDLHRGEGRRVIPAGKVITVIKSYGEKLIAEGVAVETDKPDTDEVKPVKFDPELKEKIQKKKSAAVVPTQKSKGLDV